MNYYLAVLFGLTTAIGWGLAPIFSKQSYGDDGDPIVASVILSIVGVIGLSIVSIAVYNVEQLLSYGLTDMYPFIISGVIATGLGRLLSYTGIDKIGASVNSAFIASNSVFAVLFAYIFLNETIVLVTTVGVVLVVIGLFTVSTSGAGNKDQKIKLSIVFIPLLAAILYGAGSVIRRFGLTSITEIPVLYAVTINEVTALVLLLLYSILFKKDTFKNITITDYKKFMLSGVFNTIGTSSSFLALNFGPVVIGATIGSTSTIITVFSTKFFLTNLERTNTKLYIGTITVVLGVILVVV